MGVTEDLADALARDVLERQDALGDDRFYEKVGRVIGTSSPTLQEAFLTSIRIRLAERRARAFLDAALAAKAAGQETPDAPRDYGSGH
ncbi:MAG: hypothetical protein ACK4OP_01390 [Gemmobacter sp.]